jgi:iron(III) transport system ATP-binding protein
VRVRLGACEIDVANATAADGEVTVAIRPEAIAVERPAGAPSGEGGADSLPGTIAKASYLGTHMEYSIDTAAGMLFAICPHVDRPLAAGDPVALRLAPRGVIVVEG